MRMRRKKNLEDRLKNVDDLILIADKEVLNALEAVKDVKYIDYKKIFNNINNVELEIGCGKGKFICDMAKKFPNINFLAVEMLENIIVLSAELAKSYNLKNVKFINSSAVYLPRYFTPKSISNIYLNFSPPYPLKSYENRRLTNDRHIEIYKTILKDDGAVYQKTDEKDFFEYSMQKFAENGFIVEDISLKIENGIVDNIQTEYEKKFRDLGLPIYALVAKKN